HGSIIVDAGMQLLERLPELQAFIAQACASERRGEGRQFFADRHVLANPPHDIGDIQFRIPDLDHTLVLDLGYADRHGAALWCACADESSGGRKLQQENRSRSSPSS